MVFARPGHLNKEEWSNGERLREQCDTKFVGHVRQSC
jgi:hypothetical protein